MKVILLQELKGKGIEGDVVDVSSGYANNYLLPNNLAVRATEGQLKQLEQRRHNIAKREEERMAAANELKEKMDGWRKDPSSAFPAEVPTQSAPTTATGS